MGEFTSLFRLAYHPYNAIHTQGMTERDAQRDGSIRLNMMTAWKGRKLFRPGFLFKEGTQDLFLHLFPVSNLQDSERDLNTSVPLDPLAWSLLLAFVPPVFSGFGTKLPTSTVSSSPISSAVHGGHGGLQAFGDGKCTSAGGRPVWCWQDGSSVSPPQGV